MIIFEINNSNKVISSKAIHYDCYKGAKLIGFFEIYSDYSYLNDYNKSKRKEIYIEVLEKFRGKGYSKEIYESFLKKSFDMGYKNKVFYAYILNTNKTSLALHTSLNFKTIKQTKKYTVFEVK